MIASGCPPGPSDWDNFTDLGIGVWVWYCTGNAVLPLPATECMGNPGARVQLSMSDDSVKSRSNELPHR
jgi:hypothetical protein